MKITHHKLFIILIIVAVFGSVYLYSVSDLKSEAATSSSSDLSSTASTDSSLDQKVSQDIAFLSTLDALKKIKIDTSIFGQDAFKSLTLNVVNVDPVIPGRVNPFSPVGNSQLISASTPVVTTDPATLVTDKSAYLNGNINIATGVTSIYFEYGVTNSFGLVTTPVKASLSGTFNKVITGLTSATPYYFRSVAKVGGNVIDGDIQTFTTN